MSQNDKRAEIKDTPAINEEEGAFAPQPHVPNKIRVISPVEVSEKAKKGIIPIAATTKKEHEDDINWSDDDPEIVNGTNTENEAVSEGYMNIITGDEADTTLIGSEDDAEHVETKRIDGKDEPVDIKYTDETAKPISKSSNNDMLRRRSLWRKTTLLPKRKLKKMQLISRRPKKQRRPSTKKATMSTPLSAETLSSKQSTPLSNIQTLRCGLV
jgi:hypothetical protein